MNLKSPCPTCGAEMTQAFDGGNDRLFEYCERVRPVLQGEALAAWWAEHDKRCPGPGKCDESAPVLICEVEFSPPRWLAEALAADPDRPAP